MDVFEIQQGAPYNGTLTLTDDSVTPAVPIDITGLTLFISVKALNDNKNDDSAAVISSEITDHSDPTNGVTAWPLTPTETSVRLGRYKADVKVYTTDLIFVNSTTFYIDIVPIVTKRLT